jgi:SAM-dependent methyltransferase
MNDINTNRVKGMKNFNLGMYTEIFEWNQYERYMRVESDDVVLDLGCSMGYFYFKNSELGIDYIGVDGSVDHLKDFIDNLNSGDDVKLINSVILGNKGIIEFPSMFNDMKCRTVMSMTFGDLIRLIGRKIDFMKFDIEGYESHIFSDNLDVFKKHVRKFSGEFHFSNVAYGVVSREVSMNILISLKNDKDLDFRLFSLDGVDITEYFWINPNYYNEIIISGYVKQ